MEFGESLIKFEALTQTPLKEEFGAISIDKQLEMLDGLLIAVRQYAELHKLPHPHRKTWTAFKKEANWTELAKEAIKAKTFLGKVKNSLDKLSNM